MSLEYKTMISKTEDRGEGQLRLTPCRHNPLHAQPYPRARGLFLTPRPPGPPPQAAGITVDALPKPAAQSVKAGSRYVAF